MYGSMISTSETNTGSNPTEALLGSGSRNSASSAQSQWKRDACILAVVAVSMALIAALLGAYVVFIKDHNNNGSTTTIRSISKIPTLRRTSELSPSIKIGVASAVNVGGTLTPKRDRYVPPDKTIHDDTNTDLDSSVSKTEEREENESDLEKRFLQGHDDLYEHEAHTLGSQL